MRSNFLGTVDLADAKLRAEEKKGRWLISIKERVRYRYCLSAHFHRTMRSTRSLQTQKRR